jgi:hypothetical protein
MGDDNQIEIVVDPDFHGDLVRMAELRPVWIVNTELNRDQIDHAWSVGKDKNLYEVSQIPVANPDDREGNLLMILESLDDHHIGYNIVVHGLEASDSVKERMEVEGFRITEATADRFVALRIPGTRERLIGRF